MMSKWTLLCLSLVLAGCGWTAPDAGQEAVLIDKPMIFGHGGVRSEPVRTGRSWLWASTAAVMVNMQPETYHLQIDDMMSKDGVPLDFSATIRLQVTDSVKMVTQFGAEWYKQNVEQAFFQAVRDAVKKRGMNEVAIDSSAADQIDDEVSAQMSKYLGERGIPARLVDLTIGKANPPDAVKSQRIKTAEAEQRQNTEKQLKLAEDQRKMHEESRALADNAYRLAIGLSPEQFIDLRRIDALERACESGKCTFITNGAMPTFAVK